jgi:hypothetical protein
LSMAPNSFSITSSRRRSTTSRRPSTTPPGFRTQGLG